MNSVTALLLLLTGVISSPPADVLAPHLEELGRTAAIAKAEASPEEWAVMQADIAFAADAQQRFIGDVFADRYAEDGWMIPGGAAPIQGPENVRAAFEGSTSDWYWTPVAAKVSGDLGVTWGIAAIAYTDPDGSPQVARTRYTTVWTRNDDGEWEIWMDIGNPGPGPYASR